MRKVTKAEASGHYDWVQMHDALSVGRWKDRPITVGYYLWTEMDESNECVQSWDTEQIDHMVDQAFHANCAICCQPKDPDLTDALLWLFEQPKQYIMLNGDAKQVPTALIPFSFIFSCRALGVDPDKFRDHLVVHIKKAGINLVDHVPEDWIRAYAVNI